MPLMPPREPRPEPLARARARLEFDTLVRDRVAGIANPAIAAGPVGQGETSPRVERARRVEQLARAFADAVDRENSSRGILRVGVPVDYVDAVVLTGPRGALVLDAQEYDDAPIHAHARAGVDGDEVGFVVRGRDLDAYLRTGDAQYAERIGLGS